MATRVVSEDLASAISKANVSILRRILEDLCCNYSNCARDVADELLVHESMASATIDPMGDESVRGPRPKRRKVQEQIISRYETCGTCGVNYDVTQNAEDACNLHPGEQISQIAHLFISRPNVALGEVRADKDVFPDDIDVPSDGIKEGYDWTSDERWEEWPEGFIWSCCERRQDEGNCVVRRHSPTRPESSASSASCGQSGDRDQDDSEFSALVDIPIRRV